MNFIFATLTLLAALAVIAMGEYGKTKVSERVTVTTSSSEPHKDAEAEQTRNRIHLWSRAFAGAVVGVGFVVFVL